MKKQINFNKVVSVFLVFSILLSMVPSTVKAEDSDVPYYILSEDGKTLTLTKSDPGEQPPAVYREVENMILEEGMDRINQIGSYCYNVKNVKMPNSLKTIEKYAFYRCTALTDINIPDSVTTIEEYAFYWCESLKKIRLPESVTTIGESAFRGCSNLTDINIPKGITTIEEGTFQLCRSLKNIEIPEGVVNIGTLAFCSCSSLESINIPQSVTSIGEEAFEGCTSLEKITIPHDVQIVSNPFGGCSKLTIYCYYGSSAQQCAEKYGIKYELINNIITINGITYALDEDNKTAKVIEVKKEAISAYGTLAFPDEIEPIEKEQYTVTEICAGAVKLDGIKSIQLPNKLTTIRNNAFEKYTGDVSIPGTVSYLDINAFATHDVNIDIEAFGNLWVEVYPQDTFALKNKDKNVFYGFLNDFEEKVEYFSVDSEVTEIGDRAFKYSHNFKKIKIGNQINKIGYYAFDGIEDQVIIVGYSGSYAERYAKQHNIRFENEGKLFFNWGEDNYSFGNSPSYFNSYDVGDLIKYYPHAIKEYANVRRKEEWHGSCEGMVTTAILFKMGIISQENWQSANEKADSTYHLTPTNMNTKLKELINFYHLLQYEINHCSKKIYEGNDYGKFYDSVVSYYDDNSEKNDDEKNDDEKLLLCNFVLKNSNRGHSVIITGEPQELDATFYINRDMKFVENDYYGFRIPIYDVNNCLEQEYIYIKNDFSSVDIRDDFLSMSKYNIDKFSVYSISKEDVPDIETLMENNECVKPTMSATILYKLYNTQSKLGIIDNDKKKSLIVIGNSKVSGELECDISPIYNSSADGDNNEISEAYVNLAEGENYSVEPLNSTEPLDIKLLTKDSYMSVKTTEGGKATFENNKTLSLSNPSGKEFEAVFTVNDEYMKLPWYTIKLSGENSKEIEIESTEEGYVVTGDNLKNIKLTANNLEEKTELTFNTDAEKVLLKASKGDKELVVAEGEKIADVKEADLDVYEDIDNDGTFETKTQTATISNLTEDDASEPEFENSQYDIDGNSVINTSDIVKLSHILIAPEKYADLKDKADLNSDGTTDVSDLLTLVRFMKQ